MRWLALLALFVGAGCDGPTTITLDDGGPDRDAGVDGGPPTGTLVVVIESPDAGPDSGP